MNKRISISGTHSIGKTTLIEQLKKEKEFKDWLFIPGPTRTLRELGFSINNEDSNYDPTQMMCLAIDIQNLQKQGNILQDRSLLDTVIYTMYLMKEGKVSKEVGRVVRDIFLSFCSQYDLFIIPDKNDVELVQDGVRNEDHDFRNQIEEMMFECLKSENLKYIVVKGTNEERIKQVKKIIKNE